MMYIFLSAYACIVDVIEVGSEKLQLKQLL